MTLRQAGYCPVIASADDCQLMDPATDDPTADNPAAVRRQTYG